MLGSQPRDLLLLSIVRVFNTRVIRFDIRPKVEVIGRADFWACTLSRKIL